MAEIDFMTKVILGVFPKNSKVILYGGGIIGQNIVERICSLEHCQLLCILDQKYNKLKVDGIDVLPPENIKEMIDYDVVMITVGEIGTMLNMKHILLEYGVPECKIKSWIEYRLYEAFDKFSRWGLGEIGSRIDMRLIRLEILQHYSIEENYKLLTEEQRKALKEVQNWNNLGTRKFPENPYYENKKYTPPPPRICQMLRLRLNHVYRLGRMTDSVIFYQTAKKYLLPKT